MRYITFPFIGLILGVLFGSMLGAGENRYKNKTEREMTGALSIGLFGMLGGIGGVIGGIWLAGLWYEEQRNEKTQEERRVILLAEQAEKERREKAAKSSLGLNQETTREFKEGRYWVNETRWTDFRDHTEHLLRTAKNKDGQITSIWNGVEFMNHNEKSANQNVIPTSHHIAKSQLFSKLIADWLQEHPA
jgi:hypothetical protein